MMDAGNNSQMMISTLPCKESGQESRTLATLKVSHIKMKVV